MLLYGHPARFDLGQTPNEYYILINNTTLPLKPAAIMVPRIPPSLKSCGPIPSPATAKQRRTTSMQ